MTDAKFHVLERLPSFGFSPQQPMPLKADGLVFLTGQFGRDLDQPSQSLAQGNLGADRSDPAKP